MGASASKEDFFFGDFVDKEPILFNVAFPVSFPFTGELVGSSACADSAFFCEDGDDYFEFGNVLAATFLPLVVTSELCFLIDPVHICYKARIAFFQLSNESNFSRFFPC